MGKKFLAVFQLRVICIWNLSFLRLRLGADDPVFSRLLFFPHQLEQLVTR
jgi:hypothetical protein